MGYKLINKLDELKQYLSKITVVSFDFETAPDKDYRKEDKSSLDAHKSHIVGISFSIAEGDAIYLPFAHTFGNNAIDSNNIWEWLKAEIFENPAVIKIAHNLAFEAAFLCAQGIVLQEPCYDTIAAAQLIYKNEKEFRSLADCGLKTLVPEYFGVHLPSYNETVGGLHFDELDPQAEKTINYACSDADYTLRLYYLFNNWFDRFLPKHRFIVEKVESPTSVYVGIMRYNGLPIDRTLMETKGVEAKERIAELKNGIEFIIGDISIGANASTAAFKKYLFEKLKLPKLKLTAKEKDALDDETIILLKEWCADNRPELVRLFELVQEYRHWGKLKSTYIDGYIKHINYATGRIHPDLLPLATETGRFASKNPNCQNMPRAGADDIGVRNFITASEGNILLSLDFSQIELRVGAFYCRDEKMLETYRLGGDIHAQTTSVIYRIPLEQALDKNATEYKERRTIAKNCNFGTFFGLYPKGLQKTLKFKAGLDVSLPECEKIIHNIKIGYPGLTRWQEDTKKRAEFRKYTETWLGRRRSLNNITSTNWNVKTFAQRQALNTPIQGTAADILKLALGRILKGLPDRPWLCPIMQIHDELVFELPENYLENAVIFIKECMETQPFEGLGTASVFSVPIIADASAGYRFGELKEMSDYYE